MSEESKTFAVNDRRSFTAEGGRRVAEPSSGHPERGAPGTDRTTPGEPEGPVDLAVFVVQQAVQAQSLLRQPPEGMSRESALSGVRYFISVLEMLEARTSRTPEESSLLESVLFDLRMAYVERSRVAGS